MNKRNLLTGGVAVAACALGAGVAWWRLAPREVHPPAVAAFWASRFDGPDGEPVVMDRFLGQPLLVNFWATWCPPCVEELPMLNAFQAEHGGRGWQVLGLAVDQPSAVQRFLQRMPLDFPHAMAGLGGTELSRQLGNPSGGLPFTVVFDRAGRVAQRKLGQVKPEDLVAWAAQM
jgi:thiol-disulfide isomerase/thioredoxin